MGNPPVITSANPRATFIIPRVGMNGCGSRSLVSSRPLTLPSAAPEASAAATATAGGTPAFSSSAADHAAEPQDGADRKIDAGRDDHHQLPQRQQRVHGRLAKHVHQVVEGEEVIGEQAQRRRERHQPHQRPEAPQQRRHVLSGLDAPANFGRGRRPGHAAPPVASRMMHSSPASARATSPAMRPRCMTRMRSARRSSSSSSEDASSTAAPRRASARMRS